jgi:hypothetical protein
MNLSFALDSKHPSIAVRRIDGQRADTSGLGSTDGCGCCWGPRSASHRRRRSIELAPLSVALAISAPWSLRSPGTEGKLISAVERQLRCGRGAVI